MIYCFIIKSKQIIKLYAFGCYFDCFVSFIGASLTLREPFYIQAATNQISFFELDMAKVSFKLAVFLWTIVFSMCGVALIEQQGFWRFQAAVFVLISQDSMVLFAISLIIPLGNILQNIVILNSGFLIKYFSDFVEVLYFFLTFCQKLFGSDQKRAVLFHQFFVFLFKILYTLFQLSYFVFAGLQRFLQRFFLFPTFIQLLEQFKVILLQKLNLIIQIFASLSFTILETLFLCYFLQLLDLKAQNFQLLSNLVNSFVLFIYNSLQLDSILALIMLPIKLSRGFVLFSRVKYALILIIQQIEVMG